LKLGISASGRYIFHYCGEQTAEEDIWVREAEVRIAFWWRNLRVRDVMKNLDVDGRKIF